MCGECAPPAGDAAAPRAVLSDAGAAPRRRAAAAVRRPSDREGFFGILGVCVPPDGRVWLAPAFMADDESIVICSPPSYMTPAATKGWHCRL